MIGLGYPKSAGPGAPSHEMGWDELQFYCPRAHLHFQPNHSCPHHSQTPPHTHHPSTKPKSDQNQTKIFFLTPVAKLLLLQPDTTMPLRVLDPSPLLPGCFISPGLSFWKQPKWACRGSSTLEQPFGWEKAKSTVGRASFFHPALSQDAP